MPTPTQILETAFLKASEPSLTPLPDIQQVRIDTIIDSAESQKAVLAALITSLTKKLETPSQDIRQHKVELPTGYSGRVYDTQYVTPFIRQKFPRLAMKSGSGWLTRSIEQVYPFRLDFPGKIANTPVKTAFLEILNDIEENGANPEHYLVALFAALLLQKQDNTFSFEAPSSASLTIATTMNLVREHFYFNYRTSGASRLPVIAIYSIYELLLTLTRYENKQLVPLKSHTTSDIKSRSIGDIEVINPDATFFEAVEVKHNIPITLAIVEDAFDKIQSQPVSRYYLLTTAEPNIAPDQAKGIESFIESVRMQHGCEIIVNGVMPSLKYYLRLLDDPAAFLQTYETNLFVDYEANTDIKKTHIERWLALRK